MAQKKLYQSLYFQVILAIVVGILLGHFFPETGTAMKPLGDGFIKLIKMIIAPIIFCTIVVLPQTPIGGAMMAETPIGGATLSGSMGARGAMGRGGRSSGARTFLPFGYEGGIGMSGGMSVMPSAGAGRMRRSTAGPGFGYPFRMPPSLLSGSSSMAMP